MIYNPSHSDEAHNLMFKIQTRMLKVLLLSLLFILTGHSSAIALIDLNALGAESTLAVEEVRAQEVTNEKGGVDRVEVVRKQRGLLLALLPITFTVRAVAYPDGTVEVFYPWYSSITVDHKEIVKSKVKIAVDNALKTTLVGTVRAKGVSPNPKFSAKEAEIVEEKMIEVLKASFSNNSNTQ